MIIPKDAREVYCNEDGEPIAFCPKEGIGLTDIVRVQFFQQNETRLIELAARAREKGPEFAVICIDVDDATWSNIVDALMPGYDWQQFRHRGEKPVARGVVPRELLVDTIEEFYPAALPVPDGVFTGVFAAGGISAFEM